MKKTFTTVHEAIKLAAEFGITTIQIADALNLTKQNFNNKLNGHGSKFTTVHEVAIEAFLVQQFTAVHAKLSNLLGLSPMAAAPFVPAPQAAPFEPEGRIMPASEVIALLNQARAQSTGPIDYLASLNSKLTTAAPTTEEEELPIEEELILTPYENKMKEKYGYTNADFLQGRKETKEFLANKLGQDNEEEILPF